MSNLNKHYFNKFLLCFQGDNMWKLHLNLPSQSFRSVTSDHNNIRINTDQDPSLRIESFAMINLRGVST